MVPGEGFEPPTYCLQDSRNTNYASLAFCWTASVSPPPSKGSIKEKSLHLQASEKVPAKPYQVLFPFFSPAFCHYMPSSKVSLSTSLHVPHFVQMFSHFGCISQISLQVGQYAPLASDFNLSINITLPGFQVHQKNNARLIRYLDRHGLQISP